MEWPPHSRRTAEFPEVDRAAWCSLDEAMEKANPGQRPIIAALAEMLGMAPPGAGNRRDP